MLLSEEGQGSDEIDYMYRYIVWSKARPLDLFGKLKVFKFVCKHAHIIVTVVIVTWTEYKTEILVILHSKSPVPLQISWTNKAVDNYNLIRGWWLDNTADLLQIISFQNWPNNVYFKI